MYSPVQLRIVLTTVGHLLALLFSYLCLISKIIRANCCAVMLSPKTDISGNSEPPEACKHSPPSLLSMEDANGENFVASERSLPEGVGPLQPPTHITETAVGAEGDAAFEREMCLLLLKPQSQPLCSRKVFLGGLPMQVGTEDLKRFFSLFGQVEVGWPVDNNGEHDGYMFATFASADSVDKLLEMCTRHNGRLTITMPMGNSQSANIHIRVWYTRDAKYYSPEFNESMLKTNKNCAFVGGIPRTMTAKQLADYMSITYGDVLFARIEVELETDYPKGAGCVMFRCREAFVTAVASRFVSLNFGDHIKQVEVQPYLMRPVECEICQAVKTRNFCPKFRCLKFMCELCWRQAHIGLPDHYPLMRSPPLRLRGLTVNGDDHEAEQHHANKDAIPRTLMRQNEYVYNTHNLCNVVNSIQFPPVPLFEVESDFHSDWNTDCGMFDVRGPPPSNVFRSRPLTNIINQPSVLRRYRGREQRTGNFNDQRNRWRRGAPFYDNSINRPSTFAPSYYSTIDNSGFRSNVYNHSDTNENASAPHFSSNPGENQWSEHVSRISTSPNASSVFATNVNQIARPRVSFSPTIRRPARRCITNNTQSVTNAAKDESTTSKDITDAFEQFSLF
ncbi:unnamed protein product [Cylicocyclus nassatus]|uniref:RRM domain-containing protein n=1 Tax=Cylicocyclus nassatus TaxID=53992 RepID=A0AA36GPS1_CYLNA|nr:unnamed protein product [Cylicocyclus nassatus]